MKRECPCAGQRKIEGELRTDPDDLDILTTSTCRQNVSKKRPVVGTSREDTA